VIIDLLRKKWGYNPMRLVISHNLVVMKGENIFNIACHNVELLKDIYQFRCPAAMANKKPLRLERL
jgi:hypothetical protein